MTVHTAPHLPTNRLNGRHLARWAMVGIAVLAAAIALSVVGDRAGSENPEPSSVSGATSATEPSSSGTQLQAGRPDGTFTITTSAPTQPSSTGTQLQAGRPDGTFTITTSTGDQPRFDNGARAEVGRPDGGVAVSTETRSGAAEQVSCTTNGYC